MARRITSGNCHGFTVIELLIVMAITGILVSMAVPIYQKSVVRAKESVLKQNLFTLNSMIDNFTYDKSRAPQSLQELVAEGYFRRLPIDPMTGEADWVAVMEDSVSSVNQMEPGIYYVHSSSGKRSLEGTPYSGW